MTPQSPSERVGSFLHAIRSTPIAELREALARSNVHATEGELPRANAALHELDAIVRRISIQVVVRQVEDEARRVTDSLLKFANDRSKELPLQEAAAIQLLVEWCAVALLVVEDLSEDSFRTLWEPFAPIMSARLRDAEEVNGLAT